MTEARTAVVTGGMSGLGEAFVERLREDDVHVITMDMNPAADYTVDVSDAAQVNEAAAAIGPIDILVNSAGIARGGQTLWETSDEEWKSIYDVNVFGTFAVCRAFVPGMIEKGWGRIVNVASMAGKEGNAGSSAYSSSKSAVIGLTKSLGKELATTGVLANAIAPAVFETPILAPSDPEQLWAFIMAKVPMGRMGQPREAAELVGFLCSDRVSFSTGFTYDLSGGRATY